MEPNKIDTLFKQKIERHSEVVSDNAWEQVQKQLGKKGTSNKKPIFWYAAAGIALFITAGLVYNFVTSENDRSSLALKPIELQRGIQQTFTQQEALSIPEFNEYKSVESVAKTAAVNSKKANNYVATTSETDTSQVNVKNNIALDKLTAKPTQFIAVNGTNFKPMMEKIESEIIVEMNYSPRLQGKVDELKQSTNKLKSLASEISLADLRSAKNELFASALQFEKKRVN